jgi:hypothetical protein
MRNGEWSKLVSVAGRILLAYALIFTQSALAGQNSKVNGIAESPQTGAARPIAEKQSSAAPTAKTPTKEVQGEAPENTVAEEKPSGDAKHEGIKVHGHWTIEVRNPDGALVRHVEFENSIDSGYSYVNGTNTYRINGATTFLAALLTGQALVDPTSAQAIFWQILLVGPAGLNNVYTANTTNAPCLSSSGAAPVPAGNQYAACAIVPAPAAGSCASGRFCNLTISPLGTTPVYTGIQLSGSAQATQSGQVVTVATQIGANCPNAANPCPLANLAGAIGPFNSILTSSTNFPGAPISVTAGQTIAVTVNISFS